MVVKTSHNRSNLLGLVASAAFVLAFCEGLFAQGAEPPKAQCRCQLSSLFKGEGWIIPGLDGATLKSPRAHWSDSHLTQPVSVTILKPGNKPSSITWLHCSNELPGATQIVNVDVEALDLWKFDIDGKVFAYLVTAGWFGRDKTGTLVRLGTAEDKVFYDTDGSGKFKLMKNADSPFLIEVPQWTTTASGAEDQRPAPH